jgi:hypothetical protein
MVTINLIKSRKRDVRRSGSVRVEPSPLLFLRCHEVGTSGRRILSSTVAARGGTWC